MKHTIPEHIGIIMDGNRRWATERGLPGYKGHEKAIDVVNALPAWLDEFGIKAVTLYTFSTENWNRTEDEVGRLMKLIVKGFNEHMHELKERDVKILFSGRRDNVPDDVLDVIDRSVEQSKDNKGVIMNFAFNYGGRAEIVDALVKIVKLGIRADDINERVISQHLSHPELPDPDLIIRTGGANRLSNFLTWQSVYSELYFTDTYWTDFSRDTLKSALEEFGRRSRRFGK